MPGNGGLRQTQLMNALIGPVYFFVKKCQRAGGLGVCLPLPAIFTRLLYLKKNMQGR